MGLPIHSRIWSSHFYNTIWLTYTCFLGQQEVFVNVRMPLSRILGDSSWTKVWRSTNWMCPLWTHAIQSWLLFTGNSTQVLLVQYTSSTFWTHVPLWRFVEIWQPVPFSFCWGITAPQTCWPGKLHPCSMKRETGFLAIVKVPCGGRQWRLSSFHQGAFHWCSKFSVTVLPPRLISMRTLSTWRLRTFHQVCRRRTRGR